MQKRSVGGEAGFLSKTARVTGILFFFLVAAYIILMVVMRAPGEGLDLMFIQSIIIYESALLFLLIFLEMLFSDENFLVPTNSIISSMLVAILSLFALVEYSQLFSIDLSSAESLAALFIVALQSLLIYAKYRIEGEGLNAQDILAPLLFVFFGGFAGFLTSPGIGGSFELIFLLRMCSIGGLFFIFSSTASTICRKTAIFILKRWNHAPSKYAIADATVKLGIAAILGFLLFSAFAVPALVRIVMDTGIGFYDAGEIILLIFLMVAGGITLLALDTSDKEGGPFIRFMMGIGKKKNTL